MTDKEINDVYDVWIVNKTVRAPERCIRFSPRPKTKIDAALTV